MINEIKWAKGITLSCLCAEHPEDSKCEVYLRSINRWFEPNTKELLDQMEDMLALAKEYGYTPREEEQQDKRDWGYSGYYSPNVIKT